jgi:hypothetical protein
VWQRGVVWGRCAVVPPEKRVVAAGSGEKQRVWQRGVWGGGWGEGDVCGRGVGRERGKRETCCCAA